jgi:hypothetical protein
MRPTVHITGVDPPAGALGQRRELVPRRAEHLVTEALGDIRVVALDGARQTGKSTLARLTARTPRTLPFACSMIRPRCGPRGTIRPVSWNTTG